jgi:hypothetical protein
MNIGHFLLAIALVAGPTVAGATSAGKVSGELGVSKTGSLHYRLPIELPEGIDGLKPDIAVEYDSQAGNGLLGKSFTLSGLSSIQRCGQIQRIDGENRAPSLANTDRFCLDGGRLVLDGTTKSYGADGAVYRTEIDQFAKITSAGTLGSGPSQFTVKTKSGLTHEFGSVDASRHLLAKPNPTGTAPASVLAWSLRSTTDLIGNVVTYTYTVDRDKGSQYLSQVTYNRGRAYAKFSYIDDSMSSIRFIGGGLATRGKLLDKITVYVKTAAGVEQQVRVYNFAYKYSDLKGGQAEHAVATLDTIKLCGSSGTDCLDPITFGWASSPANSAGFQAASRILTTSQFSNDGGLFSDVLQPRRFADLNGDGVLDIVGFIPGGTHVALSQKGQVASYPNSAVLALNDFSALKLNSTAIWGGDGAVDYSPRHLVDMNADGYPDIVGFNVLGSQNGVYLSFWDPETQTFESKKKLMNVDRFAAGDWGSSGECARFDDYAPRFLLDMNKDGYPDIVGLDGDGVYISYWDGIEMTVPVRVTTSLAMDTWSPTCAGQAGVPVYVEDMNGDGYPDLLGVGHDGVSLWLWDPATKKYMDGVSVLPEFIGGEVRGDVVYDPIYPTFPADVNGDGLPDLVRFAPDGVRAALWNGIGFNASSIWTDEFKTSGSTKLAKSPRRVADMNGDGFPDVVAFGSDGVRVALNNGSNGFLPSSLWSTDQFKTGTDSTGNNWDVPSKTPRHLVDLDGDGQIDIVGFGSSSTQWARQATIPGVRLISIADSLGAVTEAEYTVLQESSGFYTDALPRCTWPCRDGHGPQHVVSRLWRDTGTGTKREYIYRYEGRKFNYFEGPLGFLRTYERDSLTGIERSTTYSQSVPLIGAPKTEESYLSTISGITNIKGCTTRTALCYRSFDIAKGQPLTKRSTTYKVENLAATGENASYMRRFVAPDMVTTESWEIDGTVLPKQVVDDAYEEPTKVAGAKQWGNRTSRTTTLSKTGVSGVHTTTIEDAYVAADEANWILGRLSTRKVTTKRPAVSITTETPTEVAPTPDQAGPKPASAAVLSVILSLLLDD